METVDVKFENLLAVLDRVYRQNGLEPVVSVNGELYPIKVILRSSVTDDRVDPGTPVLFLNQDEADKYFQKNPTSI